MQSTRESPVACEAARQASSQLCTITTKSLKAEQLEPRLMQRLL